jgi:glycosyltransferase involved in cell wall biosynthesis
MTEKLDDAAACGPPPRISIVIPVYNREQFLSAAVDSVLAQTVTDWELVISDDGSTDGTFAIAACYAAGDPRIRTIHNPNGGVAMARNRGLAATDPRSEFVILLDSDDLWEPDALATLVDALESRPDLVAAHATARCIDPAGNQTQDDDLEAQMRARHGYRGTKLTPIPIEDPTTFAELIHHNWIVTSGLQLTRRAVVERVGEYDPATDPADDWDFALRVSRVGDLAFVDRPLLHWRRHDRSLTNSSPRWRAAYFAVRRKTLTDPTNTPEQARLARLGYVGTSWATLKDAWSLLRLRTLADAGRQAMRAFDGYVRYARVALGARLRRIQAPRPTAAIL